MISIILMIIAALVGFFFGPGMNEAMSGAILLSMITGFACTINVIEKNKKKWQILIQTKKLIWNPLLANHKIKRDLNDEHTSDKSLLLFTG